MAACRCYQDPNPPPGARCRLCGRIAPGTPRGAHTCHARGCGTEVRPELLMCAGHWGSVPRDLQAAVWKTYRRGQCDDKRPSKEWHTAADAAIGYVAVRTGQPVRRSEVEALKGFGYGVRKIDGVPVVVKQAPKITMPKALTPRAKIPTKQKR